MKSFNLTEWALNHRAIVVFLMLVIGIGGTLGFTRLGQLEDPNFSVPSMTVMVVWPGAIFCTPAVTTSVPAGRPETSTSSLR